ncbi:MAG: rod shape determining protein RodA [Halothiobacillaceae bacterium]|nr:MAG: rod shape determining protein RodA [Halothiobacillaceae bacterium]
MPNNPFEQLRSPERYMPNLSSGSTLHIDLPLLLGLVILSCVGLAILYSASGQDLDIVVRQTVRLCIGFVSMVVIAQISPHHYKHWGPWVFLLGLLFLIAVLVVGEIGKGAQRWLDLGLFRFQPSEIMKVAVPVMAAWYLSERAIPPSNKQLFVTTLLIIIPVLLIAKQPDLGTALLISASGIFVLLLAGMRWRVVFSLLVLVIPISGLMWEYGMHDYQRNRILTLLDPERDPLGTGYHIIQSKIAIGSGGLYGKGWLNGTQAHLEFLPESSTDFIFAVFGEEFGLVGSIVLLLLYLAIVLRGLYIATQAQNTFNRLLAGSLTLTFFVYVFVNIGMVIGILPVVGVPLPLISYGGTSVVTLMAGFGVLMSIHTHRKLLPA